MKTAARHNSAATTKLKTGIQRVRRRSTVAADVRKSRAETTTALPPPISSAVMSIKNPAMRMHAHPDHRPGYGSSERPECVLDTIGQRTPPFNRLKRHYYSRWIAAYGCRHRRRCRQLRCDLRERGCPYRNIRGGRQHAHEHCSGQDAYEAVYGYPLCLVVACSLVMTIRVCPERCLYGKNDRTHVPAGPADRLLSVQHYRLATLAENSSRRYRAGD
jgi:hypothetical protein